MDPIKPQGSSLLLTADLESRPELTGPNTGANRGVAGGSKLTAVVTTARAVRAAGLIALPMVLRAAAAATVAS
ncbi:hypothetical protein E4U54_000906 [Claviceps lovelessii]|nr:hypothetical protein E4U54_000906 [Claviceps lovelessii]